MTQREQELQEWANQVTESLKQLHRHLERVVWELENVKARLAEWEAGPH